MSNRSSLKRPGSPSKRSVTPTGKKDPLDLKYALSSAKMTFETSLKRSRSSTASGNNVTLTPPAAVEAPTPELKSSSAPASPVKAADSPVPTTRRSRQQLYVGDLSPRGRKRHQTDENKTELVASSSSSSTSSTLTTTVNNSSFSGGLLTEASKLQRRPKATPMDEVMKLHQDEGVMHILTSLPTSRRKVQTSHFSSSTPSQGGLKRAAMNTFGGARSHSPSALLTQQKFGAVGVQQRKRDVPSRNNLLRVNPNDIEQVNPETLMNPKTLERLKKLPKKDYVHLWSSTSRYKLTDEAMGGRPALPEFPQAAASSISPDSSAESDISSASHLRLPRRPQIGSRMLLCVSNVTKTYKDLVIRSYPTFAQIMLTPTTTGMRHALNVHAIDELLDALKVLREDQNVRAVMVSGLGNVFCQGVDLTVLTFDSPEKQKKSAEALAGAIRRLCLTLLDYDKLLVCGVNGDASGLGVTLLPMFDLVYANDKAMLRADYAKIGQIPEAFASVTMGGLQQQSFNELFLLGRSVTATQAQERGLVSAIVWPGRLLEEIVPRMELLEEGSDSCGLAVVKKYMKAQLRRQVIEAAEEETRSLVKCWTEPRFAKKTKEYLRSNDHVTFQ